MWPLLAAGTNITWHLVPLAIVISLVYNASRYELPERIVRRAARLFILIMLGMGAVFSVLMVLSFAL
jgi:hypothetical protein